MNDTKTSCKVAIVGSRTLSKIDIGSYLPQNCSEIISGGATGADRAAADFAKAHNIKLTEILPQYEKYGRGAPLVRNKIIVDSADMVIAFWDGRSKGTLSVLEYCKKQKKELLLIQVQTTN